MSSQISIMDFLSMIFSMIASIINDFTTSPTNEYRAVFMSNTKQAMIIMTRSVRNKAMPIFSTCAYFFTIMAMTSVPPLEAPT